MHKKKQNSLIYEWSLWKQYESYYKREMKKRKQEDTCNALDKSVVNLRSTEAATNISATGKRNSSEK